MWPLIISTKRTRIYEHTEMLTVLFSREINFWAIFVFFQYFTHFDGQTMVKLEGKIAPWYMAWGYIKLIQRKNKASSSNNCNKIFGLLKLRNFRTPNKSDTKIKTRHPLSRIRGWNISNAPVENTISRFRGKKSLLFEKKATFYDVSLSCCLG